MSTKSQEEREITTSEEQPKAPSACCDAPKKATCCEPAAKSACCGPAGDGKKGCC